MSKIYTMVKMPREVFKGRYIQFMVERGDIEFIRHYRDVYDLLKNNKEWVEINNQIKELKILREDVEFKILMQDDNLQD